MADTVNAIAAAALLQDRPTEEELLNPMISLLLSLHAW